MSEYAYEITAGDGLNLELTVTTDGEVQDLTGAAFVYVLMAPGATTPALRKTGTVAESNTISIEIAEADTQALAAGTYYHECRVRDPDGPATTVKIYDAAGRKLQPGVTIRARSAEFGE